VLAERARLKLTLIADDTARRPERDAGIVYVRAASPVAPEPVLAEPHGSADQMSSIRAADPITTKAHMAVIVAVISCCGESP
jgi:hypothetical protein